jgi:UDP-N-acetylglucosamine 2-epimerase (non-hydrolysing)
MKEVAVVLGTRPEIIKLAPLINVLKESKTLSPYIIFSGQHREMGKQTWNCMNIKSDLNLELMKEDQTPNSFLALLLTKLEPLFKSNSPAGVVIQGDTTTALGAAIAAFHSQLPIAHIEAGLRTWRSDSPFPEEMNRTVISRLATYHFAPTTKAADNLKQEGIEKNIYVVGNTVVDSLMITLEKIFSGEIKIIEALRKFADNNKRFVLLTGHRRENFDTPLKNLCSVIKELVNAVQDLEVIYPVHLNPNVKKVAEKELASHPRIHLLPPIDYPSTVFLMKHACLIISDSGGIQEEAPSLGTHVLVTREFTERTEAIDSGFATLTPLSNPEMLYDKAYKCITEPKITKSLDQNPYGDGTSARQIYNLLESFW